MQRSLSLWQLSGLTFSAVLGTLFHFLYDWTDNIAFAPFCAVNESTWEHIKILFFPMLIFAVIQSYFFIKTTPNFWTIKLIGILIGLTLIPVLFYTYNGAFGKSPDWLNILIFFLSAGIAYFIEYLLFKYEFKFSIPTILPISILTLITISFAAFTFLPPLLPLFKDPVSGGYGIAKSA